MPYGAYDRFPMPAVMNDAAQPTAIALEAAAGDKFVYTILEPCVVLGFRLLATVAMNYDTLTAAAKVALDKRTAFASDTGRTQLVELTIPQGLAAGKLLYKAFTPVKMLPGEQLVVEVTTQGAGGTEVGDWVPVILMAPAPETPGNCAAMVLSA
jgi:hypothetical protein